MRASLLKHFVALTALVALASYVWIYARVLNQPPIRSDGYSYYVYLPAWLLDGDPSLDTVARDCCGGAFSDFTGIRRWPGTDRWVNSHPIGVAILTAPFFVAAHLLTRWSNLEPDGFSTYYQYIGGLAGVAAMLAGLAILRTLLARYFTTGVTLAALAAVTWGTNLFHYGVFDSTFSHAFSFFLVAALLLLTEDWWAPGPAEAGHYGARPAWTPGPAEAGHYGARPAWRTSIALALVAALIVLTRHTNAVFLLFVPAYGVAAMSWRDAAVAGWQRRAQIAAMLIVAGLAVFPQFLMYKVATGHWFVSAYRDSGGFDFRSPYLLSVLFSVQKGLFFWSPLLLFTVAGAVVAGPGPRRFLPGAVLIFAIHTYLIASWSQWQLGASFGHRGFTDGLAFAAIFLAAFFQWAAARPNVARAVGAVAALLVLLSIAQMLQYWFGVLPMADTTWDQYRHLFLRFS